GPVVLVGDAVVGPDVLAAVPAQPQDAGAFAAVLAVPAPAAGPVGAIVVGPFRQVVDAGRELVGPVARAAAVFGPAEAAGSVEAVPVGVVAGPRVTAAFVALSPAARAALGVLAGPAALDALGGEVLVWRPAFFVLVTVVRVAVVVVVLIITPCAAATAWPRRLTTQERHTTPPGTTRPGVGASEARAAMYASLPPLSRAPLTGTGS